MMRTSLYPFATTALRKRALDNSGQLPPSRLHDVGRTLVDLLLDEDGDLAEQGREFTRMGLALSSVLAAAAAVHGALLAAGEPEVAQTLLGRLSPLILAMEQQAVAIVRDEQEHIRRAVERALAEERATLSQQRAESDRLNQLIADLSTPVLPVFDGILVVPVIGMLDADRATQMTDRILAQISRQRASRVIVDLTATAMIDTAVAQHLIQTSAAARMLGAMVIFAGITPEVAQTMVHLGIDLADQSTQRDLQAALLYALHQRGLSIRPDSHDRKE